MEEPQNTMGVDESDDTDEIVVDRLHEISRRLGFVFSDFVDCVGCVSDEIRCLAPLSGGPFYTVDHLGLQVRLGDIGSRTI
jgi:hypothetical protein